MATKVLTPLAPNVPIVDEEGNPTPYFQRVLQELTDAKINASLIEALGGDPGGDRVLVWDDSTNSLTFMTASEVLDFLGAATHGDILYRDSTGWSLLPAGTAGDVLTTNGAGADPTWETPSSGGGILYGAGAPATGLGSTGDFYFDTTNLDLYGPKAALDPAKNERYWAIVIDNCVSTQIPSAAEIEFYDTTNTLISPVTPAMIDNNGGFPTANMTNGNLSDFCLTNRNGTTPREIFWVDMGTAKEVDRIRFYRRNDGFGYNEAATTVRIYAGASAPVAPWTPTTHRSYTMDWGASHAAGITYNDLNQPQYNAVWPIALTS